MAIILVSHDMYNILRYCHSGLYLQRGHVAAAGPIDTVTAHYLQGQEALAGKFDVSHPMHSGHVPVVEGFELGKVYALDCNGHRREELCADDPVILALPVTYQERPHDTVEVELAIDDVAGLLYQTISPPLELPATAGDGSFEIHMRIDQLPLTAGKLTVGVSVWTLGQDRILGWSRNNQFRFRGQSSSPGRLAIPASWRVARRQPAEHVVEIGHKRSVTCSGRF